MPGGWLQLVGRSLALTQRQQREKNHRFYSSVYLRVLHWPKLSLCLWYRFQRRRYRDQTNGWDVSTSVSSTKLLAGARAGICVSQSETQLVAWCCLLGQQHMT
jgi:hypothetical protein